MQLPWFSKSSSKFALFWASKNYRLVNSGMRELSKSQYKTLAQYESQTLIYFASNFIRYFYTHGLQSKDLDGQYLYREYFFGSTLQDMGFIATSLDRHVAEKFAESLGSVVRLEMKRLPANVPYILMEDEVVTVA